MSLQCLDLDDMRNKINAMQPFAFNKTENFKTNVYYRALMKHSY